MKQTKYFFRKWLIFEEVTFTSQKSRKNYGRHSAIIWKFSKNLDWGRNIIHK